jgi:hypothetical protein
MKSLMIALLVINVAFIIQVTDLDAALLPNEIKVQESSVKHGPKFGEGWSEEQKKVWNKTQKWWQLRMVGDWSNLEKLYHEKAILYHYFHKVPFEFSAYEGMMKGVVFGVVYCTVHEIRIIENVAVAMIYYEIVDPIPPKRMIFVLIKQGDDWKFISTMNKEE